MFFFFLENLLLFEVLYLCGKDGYVIVYFVVMLLELIGIVFMDLFYILRVELC